MTFLGFARKDPFKCKPACEAEVVEIKLLFGC
jgi:hypothetical protein